MPIEIKSRNAVGGISQDHLTGRNENFFMAQCPREIPKEGLVNYPCPQREKSYCPEGAQSDGPSAKNAGTEYLFRRFDFLIPNMNILYLGQLALEIASLAKKIERRCAWVSQNFKKRGRIRRWGELRF